MINITSLNQIVAHPCSSYSFDIWNLKCGDIKLTKFTQVQNLNGKFHTPKTFFRCKSLQAWILMIVITSLNQIVEHQCYSCSFVIWKLKCGDQLSKFIQVQNWNNKFHTPKIFFHSKLLQAWILMIDITSLNQIVAHPCSSYTFDIWNLKCGDQKLSKFIQVQN